MVHAGFRLLDNYIFLWAILLIFIVKIPTLQMLFGYFTKISTKVQEYLIVCKQLSPMLYESHYQGVFALNLECWVVISREVCSVLDLDMFYLTCWLKRLK